MKEMEERKENHTNNFTHNDGNEFAKAIEAWGRARGLSNIEIL